MVCVGAAVDSRRRAPRPRCRPAPRSVDASWHVGASAGQYASDGTFGRRSRRRAPTTRPRTPSGARPSYGIQSRLEVRALVVEGPAGNRLAIVEDRPVHPPGPALPPRGAAARERGRLRDHRRDADDGGHPQPLLADVLVDVVGRVGVPGRLRRPLLQLPRAADLHRGRGGLRRARAGPGRRRGRAVRQDPPPLVRPRDRRRRHARRAIRSRTPTTTSASIRFDDVSDPEHPKPLANLVNWSGHPEFLEGNDLISADYIAPARADDSTARPGAVTIWTQGAVGTAEPERSTYHSIHERLEFSHRDYAQAEYAARLLTDAIVDVWDGIGIGRPAGPRPLRPVRRPTSRSRSTDRWYPGPFSHPYPGVSNCRADTGSVRRAPAADRRAAGLQARSRRRGCATSPTWSACRSRRRRRSRRSTRASTTDDFQALGHPGARELLGAPATPGCRRTSTSTCRGSGSARSTCRSAPASSGSTRRRTSRRAPTRSPATSSSATTGARSAPRRQRDLRGRRHRDGHLDLPEPGQPLAEPAADQRPEVPADARAGQQPRERLERHRERRARPSPSRSTRRDQGQLHARRRGRSRPRSATT